jgi:glucosamine--fructose-6-phosphate aminotransferase (isomerizing)
MCGIVGAVSARNIVPILIEGLRRLEYRGYDSCGVAVHQGGLLRRARSTARVAELSANVAAEGIGSGTGIAHTRWATHGAPAVHNAHPHFSHGPGPDDSASQAGGQASGIGRTGRIALVHNGIIENHDELRAGLRAKDYAFASQTDTEVIAHLIDSLYEGDLLDAVQRAVPRLRGAYAIAVFCRDEPQRVVGARHGSPLVLGVGTLEGAHENFLASDAMALAGVTDRIVYLEDGDVADLQLGKHWVTRANGQGNWRAVERETRTVQAHSGAAELGPYRHYMQKEIFEQPKAIADTLDAVPGVSPELFGDGAYRVFKQVDSVLILACGTSYYSGSVAKYWLESIAKIPTQVEVASEYRYRDSVPNARTLVVTITQSGETADTIAALKHARSLGMAHTLTVCNVATSAMVRECAMAYITRAGVEIGVASTKAFSTQLVGLFLLTLALAQTRGHLSDADEADAPEGAAPSAARGAGRARARAADHCVERGVRAQGERVVPGSRPALSDRARGRAEAEGDQLHPCRGVSGRRAETRPACARDRADAGRRDRTERRAARKAEEQPARGARARRRAVRVRRRRLADRVGRGLHVIRMPEHYGLLSPILHVVPLQLLAYHTACARGTDVDKPRNLAKSVTVE